MSKNILKELAYSLILLLTVASCTDRFAEINRSLNPPANIAEGGTGIDGATHEGIHLGDSITADNLAILQGNLSNMGTIFRKFTYEGVYNDYQRATNLTHDIYCGYFANLNPSFLYRSPTYAYDASWSDTRWNHFYLDRSVEYGQLARTFWFVGHDFKKKSGPYLNAFYMARIYYAFLISMQTDTYGDIPLTNELLQGLSNPNSPKYRKQEEVYDIIFDLLDDAITNMNPNLAGSFDIGDDDRCYGGDVNKWLRFANTLRLRLALRISNVAPEKARQQGEAALRHVAGIMKSQDDNMKTIPKFAPVDLGGENTGGDENIFALCSYTWSDCGLNKDLEVAYKSLSEVLDPRCEISWYRPLKEESTLDDPIESDNDFLGSHTGDMDIQKPSYKHSRLRSYAANGKTLRNDAWFGLSRESVWLSYAESKFLMAEAALRGWSGVVEAPFDYFIQGIEASFDYYKIDPQKRDTYISGLKILEAGKNPFNLGDAEGMLEQIITHKWLAVFPNGNEGWAEFRRTDYPIFISLPLLNSSYDVAEGKFIKRITYPGEESLINENFPFLPDGLRQDERMWWDIADTNNGNGERIKPNNIGASRISLLKNIFK